MYCKICGKELSSQNKQGYCIRSKDGKNGCYYKSPMFKEYQKKYQREKYRLPQNKIKRKKYLAKPKVIERLKKYNKEYRIEHKENFKEYQKRWMEKKRNEAK